MLTYSDFDNIVLNKDELNALKSLSKSKELVLKGQIGTTLSRLKLIYRRYNGTDDVGNEIPTDYYYINSNGEKYISYLKQKKKANLKKSFRSWVPIIISLIALLKSFSPQIHELIQRIMK